jgi:hypothetical protein
VAAAVGVLVEAGLPGHILVVVAEMVGEVLIRLAALAQGGMQVREVREVILLEVMVQAVVAVVANPIAEVVVVEELVY